MADWSALPRDLLEEISSRSEHDADYVSFRSVCTSWRSAAPKRPRFPWLFIRYLDGPHGTDHTSLALINLPKLEPFIVGLPEEIYLRRYICGSSHGWIALLDRAHGISLLNPLTGSHIQLPLLADLPGRVDGIGYLEFYKSDGSCRPDRFHIYDLGAYLVGKVVLSSGPVIASGDCQVMARCDDGHRLIHCRPGDASWTALTPAFPELVFNDIIFDKGRFYAVSSYRVFVCDTGPDAKIVEILPADPLFPVGRAITRSGSHESFLVLSSGDLLLVAMFTHGGICDVFRVDLDSGQLRLFKLQSLGGRSLFVGRHSMSISAGNFTTREVERWWPSSFHMEGGSVFTTNHFWEDGRTKQGDWGAHWFMPNLCL